MSARGHCSAPTDESECIGHGHPQDDSTWPESHNFISAGLSGGMAELAPRLHSAIATLVGGADKLRDEPLQIDSGPVSAFYHSNKNGGGVCGGVGVSTRAAPISSNSIYELNPDLLASAGLVCNWQRGCGAFFPTPGGANLPHSHSNSSALSHPGPARCRRAVDRARVRGRARVAERRHDWRLAC